MLAATAQKDRPSAAIVVSEESADYRGELNWLAARIRTLGLADVYVCSPQDIVFTEEALFVRHEDGREDRIDVLYRNFELFDLLNVPKQELMLYAARHNRIKLTPPPKAQLEEKSTFALLHHPALEALWRKELGDDVFARLRALFPQTWILDPRPVPPQAAIVGLTAGGVPVSDWLQLETLGKGERDYVVKPSGFSALAWGSRGVRIANDLTREDWRAALVDGLAAYETHAAHPATLPQRPPHQRGILAPRQRRDAGDGRPRAADAVLLRDRRRGAAGRHSGHGRAGRQALDPRHERCDHGALRDRGRRRLKAVPALASHNGRLIGLGVAAIAALLIGAAHTGGMGRDRARRRGLRRGRPDRARVRLGLRAAQRGDAHHPPCGARPIPAATSCSASC